MFYTSVEEAIYKWIIKNPRPIQPKKKNKFNKVYIEDHTMKEIIDIIKEEGVDDWESVMIVEDHPNDDPEISMSPCVLIPLGDNSDYESEMEEYYKEVQEREQRLKEFLQDLTNHFQEQTS